MVGLITLFESAQNSHGVFHAGLSDEYLLESTLQSSIFFNVFAVFIQGSGANKAQFATGQHGLEHVGRSNRSFASASSHQGVELIDKGDDFTLGIVDFFQHRLETFLEFSAVFRPRHQSSHIERDQLFTLERICHITSDDALGEALHD